MLGFRFSISRSWPRDFQKITRCLILKNQSSFVQSLGGTCVVDSAPQLDFGLFSNPSRTPEYDTLDDKMYPNAGSSDAQTDLWRSIYSAPIANPLTQCQPRCRSYNTLFELFLCHILTSGIRSI
ncbi:hypothetical protein BYT27DRAFT_6867367 [Phlegmacium glaucopus]|nr:hypothetical protein BYT27DRAFT_6867367 [Phlegmacium glaucopus]